jgi:hypothetical protein
MAKIVTEIETHEFSDKGDGTCDHPVYQTTCGYPPNDVIHGYKALPADWFEDSSLETWFPLTAEELTRTKAERDQLRTQLATAQAELAALRKNGVESFVKLRMAYQCEQCDSGRPLILNSAGHWSHHENGNHCCNSSLYKFYLAYIAAPSNPPAPAPGAPGGTKC